jgi:hypothetical protein
MACLLPEAGSAVNNCGLGHDVERISCIDAARAIIANSNDPHRLRDAAVYVLAELAIAEQSMPKVTVREPSPEVRAQIEAWYDTLDD